MGNRKSTADKISATDASKILSYYGNHTAAATIANFAGLNRSVLSKLLTKYGIEPHSAAEAEVLKHLKSDGYDLLCDSQIDDIYETYGRLQNIEDTCDACGIKEYFLVYLLNKTDIEAVHRQARVDRAWRSKLSDAQVDDIINFYAAPHTLTETKEAFKLSEHCIRILLEERHITPHARETTERLGKARQKRNLEQAYGVTNVFQLDAVKAKSRATKLEKYGDAAFTNREAAHATCKARYGSDNFLGSAAAKSNAVYDKSFEVRQANILAQLAAADDKQLYLSCYNDRDAAIKLIQSLKHNTVNDLAQALGISHNAAYIFAKRLELFDFLDLSTTNSSFYESEIVDFIGKSLCVTQARDIIPPYEIDIYVPTKKLGIEFNGTYWHSSLYKDKNYHFMKSKLAEAAGVRLIHIYEYEWADPELQRKLKLLLNIALGRISNRIYARQCDVRQISNKEARPFNEATHLQGHRNAQVTYGLFYGGSLVQLMSFSKTKYNKNLADNEWEIIRGCPGSNNIVVGGVSKLLSHFIRDYAPAAIFSYCDFNKFDGKSYLAAGMQFVGYTGPDMKWLMQDGEVVNRRPQKHEELKSAAKAQIFGAGSKKFKLQLR